MAQHAPKEPPFMKICRLFVLTEHSLPLSRLSWSMVEVCTLGMDTPSLTSSPTPSSCHPINPNIFFCLLRLPATSSVAKGSSSRNQIFHNILPNPYFNKFVHVSHTDIQPLRPTHENVFPHVQANLLYLHFCLNVLFEILVSSSSMPISWHLGLCWLFMEMQP